MDAVVLVEGISDRLALETLARRRVVDVTVVDMGGAHAIRRFLCSSDNRKLRYVPVLVELAHDEGSVPRPLDAVLLAVARPIRIERIAD